MKSIPRFILWCTFILAGCGQVTPTAVVVIGPPDTAVPTPTRMLFDDTPAPSAAVPTAALTDIPAPTATAAPSPTPAPVLRQLTQGGCCVQPFWSADSRQVLFLDKPPSNLTNGSGQPQTGFYAVDVDSPAAPRLVTARIANYTSDMQYAVSFDGAFTVVERLADNQQWRLATGGRNINLSPDRTRALWNVTPETFPFENRVTTVMLAVLGQGGSAEPSKLTTVLRGGALAWLDNQRLLMTARLVPGSEVVTLFVYSLVDGSKKNLAQSERLRGVVPAPGGDWVAYTIAFDKDNAQNGTWVMRTDGTLPRKLDFFGGFQWRDSQRIVYVPLELNVASHAFSEYNVATDSTRRLTDPAQVSFKIVNGDWAISPDGKKIVFVNAQDMNLWFLSLP